MTTDQATKAVRFRALHERPEPLLLPNPWDAGTARLLASLGFEALATTSLGVANAAGRARATRQEILDNCRAINEATTLPVNADLENGFADEPAGAARMIEEAGRAGAVGVSIEDFCGDGRGADLRLRVVRRAGPCGSGNRARPAGPVLLTAQAENLLHGVDDLGDTIKRLQAFENAGADVLYAPGLRTLDEMRTVVSSVSKPVNVVMGFADPSITLEQLREIGVRRVSIGGALSRLALKSFMAGARQMRNGRFGFVSELPPISALHEAFGDR